MSQKNRFLKEKNNRINAKQDLSLKGSIDEPIVGLIETLNSSDDYYTTSSCSGRITVLADTTIDNKKSSVKWQYITHSAATSDAVITALSGDDRPEFATFKFEPFVLHVCADGLTAAKRLLDAAIASGFRNSGLSISKSERIIVAVRNCQSLEVPIIRHKELIVSEDYIEYIVEIANKKLDKNLVKINKFYSIIKSLIKCNTNEWIAMSF